MRPYKKSARAAIHASRITISPLVVEPSSFMPRRAMSIADADDDAAVLTVVVDRDVVVVLVGIWTRNRYHVRWWW